MIFIYVCYLYFFVCVLKFTSYKNYKTVNKSDREPRTVENSSTVQEQEMNKKLNKFLVYNELINQLKLLTINLASTWTDNPPKQKRKWQWPKSIWK